MMWYMIQALLLTLGIVVVDIFAKNLKRIYVYGLIYVIMLFGAWFFTGKAHASEVGYRIKNYEFLDEMTADARQEIQYLRTLLATGNYKALSPSDRKYYEDKLKFHQDNGLRTFKEAKSKCWWLPDLDDRQNARYCFEAVGALIAPPTPATKAIAVIVTTLIQYGIDCLNEWEFINNKLYWSQYHYEMAEFYENLLKKA